MTSAFDVVFGAHVTKRDRFESHFTIIAHDLTLDKTLENLKHHLNIIDKLSDRVKRNFLYDRLNNFKTNLEKQPIEGKINCIFLIGEETVQIALIIEWLAILKEFSVDNWMFKYGEYFHIDYLRSLLTDHIFADVISVNNTKLQHCQVNSTKRKVIYSADTKNVDLTQYLQENVKTKCVIHGVSSVIKNFKSDKHMVYTRVLKDDEIMEIFEKATSLENNKEFEEWLNNMQNPKLTHRLVFGKDIQKKMSTREIKKVYCTDDMKKKIKSKLPIELQNFDICVLKEYERGDSASRLQNDFGGIVGITYY
jgi:hypothetical protein